MSSLAAKQVAREVLETIGKGEKPNLGKIIKKKGYAHKTSLNPQEVTNTKSYQDEISPVIRAMEKERERLIEALGKKNLSKEKYRDMVDGIDKLTKNTQLLNGGKTSNEKLEISWS